LFREVFAVVISFEEGEAGGVDMDVMAGERRLELLLVDAADNGIGDKLTRICILVARGED
jgi:hypothetical protein